MNSQLLPANLCPSCFKESNGTAPCPYCGYDSRKPLDDWVKLPPGFVLEERYVMGHSIGHGGFGITYLAYDTHLQQRIAIKEYFPIGLSSRQHSTFAVASISHEMKDGFETGKRKFLEEAQNLVQFKNHPNIVSIRGFFQANGTAYLAMVYYEGRDFLIYLKERGNKIPFAEAMQYLSPIMKALDDVHAHGFIHRDVSPDNIFITNNGEVRLLDFGAAKSVMSILAPKTVSVAIGKDGYCPPEQMSNKNMGPWTDAYGMAATLYRALTGEVPASVNERVIDEEALLPPTAKGADVSQKVDAAILRGLSLKYQARWQSMPIFEEELTGDLYKIEEKQPETQDTEQVGDIIPSIVTKPEVHKEPATPATSLNPETKVHSVIAALILLFIVIVPVYIGYIFLENHIRANGSINADGLYSKGLDCYHAEDYKSAFNYFLKAADQGHAGAQNALGVMYAKGMGVVQNDNQAVYWLRKAADQGDANAQCTLGIIYANGMGVVQNDKQAVYWLWKAADQGNADAQYSLGFMYENGRGVLTQDDEQSVYWYSKAAEQGHADAQYKLHLRTLSYEFLIGDFPQQFFISDIYDENKYGPLLRNPRKVENLRGDYFLLAYKIEKDGSAIALYEWKLSDKDRTEIKDVDQSLVDRVRTNRFAYHYTPDGKQFQRLHNGYYDDNDAWLFEMSLGKGDVRENGISGRGYAMIPGRQTNVSQAVNVSQSRAEEQRRAVESQGAIKIGSIIPFGKYNWRVLDVQNGRALILSDRIIERREYHGKRESITWEQCDLRRYLNSTFYNSFSTEDRVRIAQTKIRNPYNPWFGTNGGNETADKIFILSLDEVVKYFGDSGLMRNRPGYRIWIDDLYNSVRIAVDSDGSALWWLRSPGGTSNFAAHVDSDGNVRVDGNIVNNFTGGVRPALWLNL